MAFTLPIQLKGYNRRVDSSVAIKVESQIIVSSEDIAKIDSLVGNLGVLVVGDSIRFDLSDKEIQKMIEDMPKYDTQEVKSPSKRYKAILYRVLEKKLGRKPTEREFANYYVERYEKLCEDGLDYLNSEL